VQRRRGWRERRKSGSLARLEKQRPTRSNRCDPPRQPPWRGQRTASSPCSLFPVSLDASENRSVSGFAGRRWPWWQLARWLVLAVPARCARVLGDAHNRRRGVAEKKRVTRGSLQSEAPGRRAPRCSRRVRASAARGVCVAHARLTGAGDRNFALPPSDSTSVSVRRVSVALARSNCWWETGAVSFFEGCHGRAWDPDFLWT
jgi:hypothetical protein